MLVYEIIIWSILIGLWIWLQLWNVQLTKINRQLQKQIYQLQRELGQYKSRPSQTNHMYDMPPPASVQ